MTIRDKVAAFAAVGAVRAALTDSEAIALAAEVAPQNHAEQVEAALAQLAAAGPQPSAVNDVIAWARKVEGAHAKFWDAYEGEVVDGVEIVRVRA